MTNMLSILDTIRANASIEYQQRVPQAVKTSLEAVGQPILEYQTTQNEFLNALVNRIAFTLIRNKTASNPLAVLKKGTVPLGSDIQEIFTNMANDTGFDPSGSKLLTRTDADVKAIYHRLARKSQYQVTISKQQLQTAFISTTNLESMLSSIVTSLYSGDNFDEFILMKNMFADAIKDSKIVTVTVPHIKDESTGKQFVKAVKNASSAFLFPSSAFNKYYDFRPADDKGKPVTTWTPLEDQILIVRADVMNEIDVEVLASAFNLDKMSFMASVLKVDSFGTATDVVAVLCDRSFIQVYDNNYEITDFFNGQGLYWNYWLHHWQTYSISLFANAIAFRCNEETLTLDKTTLTFANASAVDQTIVATTTPVGANVSWITSDAKVATVVGGVVNSIGKGTAIISAVSGDKVVNCMVTVTA